MVYSDIEGQQKLYVGMQQASKLCARTHLSNAIVTAYGLSTTMQ